jgi:hypothetical protein
MAIINRRQVSHHEKIIEEVEEIQKRDTDKHQYCLFDKFAFDGQ